MPETQTSSHELLVIGAGRLGGRVASLWRGDFPNATIVAETKSARRHPQLLSKGVEARVNSDQDQRKFHNVLASMPPSAVRDYRFEMQRAVDLWSGMGRLVMVSSTAVYAEVNGGICEEGSKLANDPRAERMLAAESEIIDAGGIVVRMAGLYDRDRGPHIVYLQTRKSNRRPDGVINLIHYDDAAELCVAILRRGEPGEVYLGCDDAPITRQELVELTVTSKFYGGGDSSNHCNFIGTDGPRGRRCKNSRTRSALRWQPRVASFPQWLVTSSR